MKAAVRRDLKNAVSEIAKGFTIDSKSIDESKKNSETKSQSFQLQ